MRLTLETLVALAVLLPLLRYMVNRRQYVRFLEHRLIEADMQLLRQTSSELLKTLNQETNKPCRNCGRNRPLETGASLFEAISRLMETPPGSDTSKT